MGTDLVLRKEGQEIIAGSASARGGGGALRYMVGPPKEVVPTHLAHQR